MKQITITVPSDPSKEVKVETDGFIGKACAETTEALLAKLGGGGSRKTKPEYDMIPVNGNLQLQ